MDYTSEHNPNLSRLKDELAAKNSAWLAPWMSDIRKEMGVPMPENVEARMFALPASERKASLDATELPLCEACSNISNEALNGKGYLHSRDLQALDISAQQCGLCKMMQRKIWTEMIYSFRLDYSPTAQFTNQQLLEAHKASANERGFILPKQSPLVLKKVWTNSSGYRRVMMLTEAMRLQRDDGKIIGGRVGGYTLGSLLMHEGNEDEAQPLLPRDDVQGTLARMRKWLEGCEKDVNSWSARLKDTALPTRVLDLGPFTNEEAQSSDNPIRLLETNGMCGRYVTLSYCWGGYTDCRTLKANLKDHYSGIAYSKLPNVFQQAITVTRGLRIRYLWIDALCIVQDDPHDWRFEAAQMADVYWNGACRLAITHCPNPTHDFFPPKDIITSVRVRNLEKVHNDNPNADDAVQEEDEWVDTDSSISSNSTGKRQSTDKVHVKSSDPYPLPSETEKTNSNAFNNTPLATTQTEFQSKADTKELSFDDSDEFTRAMKATEGKFSRKLKEKATHSKVYFTFPKSYSRDVDEGLLNTRGWVLQERLLAPRSIHFTEDHIYFEEQDDICGEDWARKQFTWLSCVDKFSKSSRNLLFPEDSIRSVDGITMGGRASELEMLRSVFGQRNYRHENDSSHTWLKIAESFSACNFTYKSDKIVAISGLVKRKQLTPGSGYEGSKNYLGLWDATLHIDLAWLASGPKKLDYLTDMKLPSWSWMAYDGCITFTLDRRNKRDLETVQAAPIPEIKLIQANLPDLPDAAKTESFPRNASLVVTTKVRPLCCCTAADLTDTEPEWPTRQDMAEALPYIQFHPDTSTIPILMAHLSDSKKLYDEKGELIGMVSFDEAHVQLPVDELICAHLSTIQDVCRSEVASQKAFDSGLTYTIPCPPILAYALVLRNVDKGTERESYARVGLAEVNYEWITSGVEETLTLV